MLDPKQAELQATIANSLQSNQLRPGEHTGDARRYLNAPLKWDLGAEVRKAAFTLQNQSMANKVRTTWLGPVSCFRPIIVVIVKPRTRAWPTLTLNLTLTSPSS